MQHFGATCGACCIPAVLVASSYSTPSNTLPSSPIYTPNITDCRYIYIYIYIFVYRYTHKLTAALWRQMPCSHLHTLLHTAVSHLDQFARQILPTHSARESPPAPPHPPPTAGALEAPQKWGCGVSPQWSLGNIYVAVCCSALQRVAVSRRC